MPADPPNAIHKAGIVIPAYNSQETLATVVDAVFSVVPCAFPETEVVVVNDGSTDDTDAVARGCAARYPGQVTYVALARNFGEHNAVMCGLRHSTADAVAIIDDDMQNPPEEALRLLKELEANGHDVVYGCYETKHHAHWRNWGSRFNGWAAEKFLGKPAELYLSSFKALNRFLIHQIVRYEGPYPYVDGLILQTTRRIGTLTVAHRARAEGRSNYSPRRLVRLWLNMLTTFSVMPLRAASLLGILTSATALLMALFFALERILAPEMSRTLPPGWASTIVSITLFAGAQLLVLGVLGEYLGRIYMALNRQPQSVVREVLRVNTEGDRDG